VRDGVAMEPVPGRYNNGSGTQNLTKVEGTTKIWCPPHFQVRSSATGCVRWWKTFLQRSIGD